MKFVLFSMQEIRSFMVRGVFILGLVFLGGVYLFSTGVVTSKLIVK